MPIAHPPPAPKSKSTTCTSASPTPSLSTYPPRLIPISQLQDRFYIWSASDVLHLRSHHRIIGILTGSLPLLPQQNAYLGLPLQLMPEEVALLIQRRAAVLVDDEVAHQQPTKEGWLQWQREKDEEITRQRRKAHDASVEQKRRFEEALIRSGPDGRQEKRGARQREKLRLQGLQDGPLDHELEQEQEADNNRSQEGSSRGGPSTTPPPLIEVQGQAEQMQVDLSSYSHIHTTSDSSYSLPWYTAPPLPTALSSSTGASTVPFPSSSSFPSSLLDLTSTKQCIFTYLNTTRNFYLSCGLRFGGDFVAYPGDPFRYHSHYTLTVPQDDEEGFEVGRMIAQGRLGTAVKKVHLIATRRRRSKDDEAVGEKLEQEAEQKQETDGRRLAFYSLTWAGFGT